MESGSSQLRIGKASDVDEYLIKKSNDYMNLIFGLKQCLRCDYIGLLLVLVDI